MTTLNPELLARGEPANAKEMLREDLEDSLKEYSELDVLVEILQNSLDALDYHRFTLICEAAARDPKARETTEAWNGAVLQSVKNDADKYVACTSSIQKAVYYQECLDDARRRSEWWGVLALHMGGTAESLEAVAAAYQPELRITARVGISSWIEVEDNGIGIDNIVNSFRHKISTKRSSNSAERRLGTRGSHGWGLSAVLGMSDRVEIVSKVKGAEPKAYAFSNYSSFLTGQVSEPTNETIELDQIGSNTELSTRLQQNIDDISGTHIRVQLRNLTNNHLLGNTFSSYSHEKLINLLRLYTPVGQVNDYLLHPAYHNIRKGDITINLRSVTEDVEKETRVEFDVFRLSDNSSVPASTYSTFVNTGWPGNVSVHTIHRSIRGGNVYLSASEIQPATLVRQAEDRLKHNEALPGYDDENDQCVQVIPRGFYLALSGGMKAEYLVRPPRSTSAAFRGFVLSETARPTLGRKHIMDQRNAVPKTASEHEAEYDDVRRKVLPDAVPPPASPAAARWRREFFVAVRNDISGQCPFSKSLRVWAGDESREARVMLLFAELLQRGYFGDMSVLRAHLQDKYDFAFLYRGTVGSTGVPNAVTIGTLHTSGYLRWEQPSGVFHRYGVGEFKASGDSLFDDFQEDDPRKSADAIDLLICWSFDPVDVADRDWGSEEVTDINREFEGQTHIWRPGQNERRRSRSLPVVSLKSLIEKLVASSTLETPPTDWPDSTLPEVYF